MLKINYEKPLTTTCTFKRIIMRFLFRFFACTSVFLLAISFVEEEDKTTIWLCGDSTVCDQPLDRAPVTGWGTPFAQYFDEDIVVKNRARGGRSTRTFMSEGRWKAVSDSLRSGDYVMIQFGHNDEAKEPQYKDRYTPVPDYKVNLETFINETRAKGAHPILVTPVTRMRFDKEGNMQETHKEYSAAVHEVGGKMDVPVIDLDKMSRDLLQEYGPETSKHLFMFLDSLENPHYPEGRKDWTHFNEYGARKMAQLVLKDLKQQKLPLADRITKKVAP